VRFSRALLASGAVLSHACSMRAAALAVAALAAWPHAAAAQAYAQPMVQALPDPAALRLNDALRRLAQDPRSLTALVDAGQASLSLDDVDAAEGFYRRAEGVAPADGRVKAGIASVMVRRLQPVEALRLFAEAEQAGEPMRFHAAERGLAYDLIGDNAKAQEQYRLFLSLGDDPLVTRRLALSQAIAGDQRASETTLLPLLQRTDLAAYRTRAFALAILGRPDEAVSIAETMLPAPLAGRMAPYLRYMPRLTRAQQAAAANLGVFPQAARIGRDDPALAAFVPPATARPPAQTADARLVPSGAPLGAPAVREGGIPRREEVAIPLQNGEGDQTQSGGGSSPPGAALAESPLHNPSGGPSPRPGVEVAPVAAAELDPEYFGPPATVVAVLEPEQEVPQPGISLAQPAPAPATASPPAEEVDLSVAFADFSLPARSAVAEGAVDITLITPRREAPPAPARAAPPPKPVIPSRHWVQVATGRDTGALEFDWRRIKREAGGLLDRPAPHVAVWGQTNRLVAGPFTSAREADQLVARLKEKKVDSFRFTSAQGEEVKPLR
jgi:tetratricopeptide (TPR) repeat protein